MDLGLPADLRLRRRDIAIVIALGLVQAVALVVFSLLLLQTVAALTPGTVGEESAASHRRALWNCALLLLTTLITAVSRRWEFTVAERAGYEVVRRVRMRMYAHLQRMLPHHIQFRARGGLLLRLTGDLSMLRMWLSRGVLEGTVAAMVLTAGLGFVFWINLNIGLALLATMALSAALSLANGHQMRRATRAMRRRRSLLIGNITEQISALPVIQTAGRAKGEYARLSRQNDSLTRALNRVAGLRGKLRGQAYFQSMVGTIAVLAVGLIETRHLRVGASEVITAITITRFLSRPVRQLGLVHDYWHRGQISLHKIRDFLTSSARPLSDDELPTLRVGRGRIEFRDVCGTQSGLQNITCVAEAGDLVVVTGPNGSGKSALLQLLSRQADPCSGTVLIDEQDLSTVSPLSVARRIGVAGDSLPLLRGTLRRNLTYASPHEDDAELQRVAYALGIDHMVTRLGSGLTMWLTEGGGNLSAGDRQLIAIGRALLGNPPVLLLDDPMTALDQDSKRRVRELLIRHHGTVILVSSDPADLELADQVWQMSEGRLEAMTGDAWRERAWRERRGGPLWLVSAAH